MPSKSGMIRMSKTKTVVLVGVGGQGILLVSKVLSELLVQNGHDVKMSEVHGMAQRGGSVSTQIRFGEKVNSPFVGYGGADILLGFEKMETYRFLPYLKNGGTVIYADTMIPSAPIFSGKKEYPQGLDEQIEKTGRAVRVPVTEWASEIGGANYQNTVLLGVLASTLGIGCDQTDAVLRKRIQERFYEKNKKALSKGYEFAKGQ